MFSRHVNVFRLVLILAAFSGVCSSAWGEVAILPDVESGKIVDSVEWIKPDESVRLTLQNKAPSYWFLFGLCGVKNKTLTIDVVGQSSANGHFYWAETQPVVTDTLDLSDPLLYDELGYQQQHGSLPWRHILGSHYDRDTRTLSMKVHFNTDEATIALTYPCPVSYVEKQLKRLSQKEYRGRVGIYSAGTTNYTLRELPMRIITVPAQTSQNAARWKTKPTILLYGAEWPTEHESSQVIMGGLEWLLSGDPMAQKFTEDYNVVFIPHLFPDQTVQSEYGGITDGFNPGDSAQAFGTSAVDNVTWAKFLDQYIDKGNRLDVIIDFGSPSSNPNLICPMIQYPTIPADFPLVKSWNKVIMAQYQKDGFSVFPPLCPEGDYGYNLAGWLDDSFGATATFFDVSSQDITKRLSLTELRSMGADALKGAGVVFGNPRLMAQQQQRELKRLTKRKSLKAKVLGDKNSGYNPKDPSQDWVYNDWF